MEDNGAKPPKCGQCRHWHKLPANPQALGVVNGECRFLPPFGTTLYRWLGNNAQIVGQTCQYPQLPPDYIACSQFEPRLEVIAPD